MPIAEILPQSTGPYVALMIFGFVIGVLGHLSRSRWLVTLGIVMTRTSWPASAASMRERLWAG
jgi:hypothetical protein